MSEIKQSLSKVLEKTVHLSQGNIKDNTVSMEHANVHVHTACRARTEGREGDRQGGLVCREIKCRCREEQMTGLSLLLQRQEMLQLIHGAFGFVKTMEQVYIVAVNTLYMYTPCLQ